jgi:hypothetical protein
MEFYRLDVIPIDGSLVVGRLLLVVGRLLIEARIRVSAWETRLLPTATTLSRRPIVGGQSHRLNIRGLLNGRPSMRRRAGKRARRIQVRPIVYPNAQTI